MNLLNLSLGFSLLAVVLSLVPTSKESPYMIKVLDSGQCPDHPNTILKISKIDVNRISKDDYTLSGTVKIQQDAYGPLYMGGAARKCEEGKPDKCTHYGEMMYNDLCEELKDTTSYTYDLFNNSFGIVNPSCPFKKGTIKIDSKSMDVSKFDYIATMGKLWRVFLYFYLEDKKTLGGCAYFLIELSLKNQPGKSRYKNSKMGR